MFIERWTFIGIDLGQRRNYTAIAVVERVLESLPPDEARRTGVARKWTFIVRTLERLPLGTKYPDVVKRIRQYVQMAIVEKGCTLVVDGTGVGAPVVDLLRVEHLGCSIAPILITGGDGPGSKFTDGYESVPRSLLLTTMEVLVQQRKLFVAARGRNAETLRREMLGLKRGSVANTGDGGEYDDLVFAVALALWKAKAGLVMR